MMKRPTADEEQSEIEMSWNFVIAIIGLAAGTVAFCYSTFATKEFVTTRSEFTDKQLESIDKRLDKIDEKLDRLLRK